MAVGTIAAVCIGYGVVTLGGTLAIKGLRSAFDFRDPPKMVATLVMTGAVALGTLALVTLPIA